VVRKLSTDDFKRMGCTRAKNILQPDILPRIPNNKIEKDFQCGSGQGNTPLKGKPNLSEVHNKSTTTITETHISEVQTLKNYNLTENINYTKLIEPSQYENPANSNNSDSVEPETAKVYHFDSSMVTESDCNLKIEKTGDKSKMYKVKKDGFSHLPLQYKTLCNFCGQACWLENQVEELNGQEIIQDYKNRYCRCVELSNGHCKAVSESYSHSYTQQKHVVQPLMNSYTASGSDFVTEEKNFSFLINVFCPFLLTHIIIFNSQNVQDRLTEFIIQGYDSDSAINYDSFQNMTHFQYQKNDYPNSSYVNVDRELLTTYIQLEKPIKGSQFFIKLLSAERCTYRFNKILLYGLEASDNLNVPRFTVPLSPMELKEFQNSESLFNCCDIDPWAKLFSIFPLSPIQQIKWNWEKTKFPDIPTNLPWTSQRPIVGNSTIPVLPNEIIFKILLMADTNSMISCSYVCTQWHKFLIEQVPYALNVINICEFLSLETLSITKATKYQYPKKSLNYEKFRITQLEDTIQLLITTIKNSNLTDPSAVFYTLYGSNTKLLSSFTKFAGIINNLILDTYKILYAILNFDAELNDNFDTIEFSIRRTLNQVQDMFLSPKDPGIIHLPHLIIEDEELRSVWVQLFGKKCYWVSFSRFERVYLRELKRLSYGFTSKIETVLRFTVHFPANNCVSTYSVHLLGCHWGPFRDISSNISDYALKDGFAGMINMYQACKELEKRNPNECYLIRYSRQCPELLTISHFKNNSVRHTRKSRTESIKSILQKDNIEHCALPVSFKWDEAEQKSATIYEYVTDGDYYSYGYKVMKLRYAIDAWCASRSELIHPPLQDA